MLSGPGIQVLLSNIAISEGQVDARIADFCSLRKAVLPAQLYIAKHKQQAAVMQKHLVLFFFRVLVSQHKSATRAEAQRRDLWLWAKRFFIITVPSHIVTAVAIEVYQRTV